MTQQNTLDTIAATLAALQIQIAALKGESPAETPAMGVLQGSPYEGGKPRRYLKFNLDGAIQESVLDGEKKTVTTLPADTYIKGVLSSVQLKVLAGASDAKQDWQKRDALGIGFVFDCGDQGEVILSVMQGTQTSTSFLKSIIHADLTRPVAVLPKTGETKNVVWATIIQDGQNVFTKENIPELEALSILAKRGITLGGDIPPELGGTSTQQSAAPFGGVQPQAQQSPWQDWLMSNKANLESHYGISIPVEDIKTIIGDVLGTAGARAADIQTEDQAQSVYQAMAALAHSISVEEISF